MSRLAEALAILAPAAEPLGRNRIREMGRTFAIEKRPGDEVVGVRLDAPGRRGLVLRIVSRAKGRPVSRSCQALHTWLHGKTEREAGR